jgi:hypothetical protein
LIWHWTNFSFVGSLVRTLLYQWRPLITPPFCTAHVQPMGSPTFVHLGSMLSAFADAVVTPSATAINTNSLILSPLGELER